MRRRHTEEQILAILHEADAGRKIDDLCRSHGIAKHTSIEPLVALRCE